MNISKCAVEKKIEDRALGNVFCFLKLRDNWSILCGCDKVIEGERCCFTNSLSQIDKDRVIIGGYDSFCIVNIDKCVIEKRIKDESLGNVFCFLKLRDNKTILCGCNNGRFCFYDMNTEQYKITNDNHCYAITDLLLIDDNTFLCSTDTTIKVWRY